MRKTETHRCCECSYLIYSKKKVKQKNKYYHLTCYNRLIFDTKLTIDEYNELKGQIRDETTTTKETGFKAENTA